MSARIVITPGILAGTATARKRRRCDGHLRSDRHFIEPGDRYVASACPPDHPEINNAGWLHHNFCLDCAPLEYVK